MLRRALYLVGALLLVGAACAAVLGVWPFALQLLIGGALLTAGIVWERWRYKPVQDARPDPLWADTGERFVDPDSGLLTGVYSDRHGERHYVRVDAAVQR